MKKALLCLMLLFSQTGCLTLIALNEGGRSRTPEELEQIANPDWGITRINNQKNRRN